MKLMPLVIFGVLAAIVETRRIFHKFGPRRIYEKPDAATNRIATKCGYDSCPIPKKGILNVHIVPHSHDDVGWVKTVDQYYHDSVRHILKTVVEELLNDPDKRFIYVESAFFFQWWTEQSKSDQDKVKDLVEQGRLEFIGGAWSMNDEATVLYQSTIDQFTWGLRKLNDTFGECGRPKVGWQIDPFGHSREQASLFAQMGYDGMFLGRLDYQDQSRRMSHREAEMVWHGSTNLMDDTAKLFTGVLGHGYYPPTGFCFESFCGNRPINDGNDQNNNVDQKVNQFIAYVKNQSANYLSDHLIETMGGDFHYMDAKVPFGNLDKLIKYTNQRQQNGSNVNVFYSTPSCYLKSLHDAKLLWPTKTDDFFPYASEAHSYWTGFFTSRPAIKRFERVGNHLLQVCKQLSALGRKIYSRSSETHLNFFREAMGIMQHHDAVTGTETQFVANDYASRLTLAIRACGVNVRNVLNLLTASANAVSDDATNGTDNFTLPNQFEFSSCLGLNISTCDTTETNDHFITTIYNPLAHSTFQYVRHPVSSEFWSIRDYQGRAINYQVVPIPDPVQALGFRSSPAVVELVFLASELPPLGFKSYYVSKEGAADHASNRPEQMDKTNRNGHFKIGNQYINLTFNEKGLLEGVESNGGSSEFTQTFFYYEGMVGGNLNEESRSSGAYIFRPNSKERILSNAATVRVVRGPLVEEVHQVFNSWLSQVIRIYRDENHAEFEWMVGGIPIDDNRGKEVVSRFSTGIDSKGQFYTDSNGRETLRRIRNQRSTWNATITEPVAGNYYPVTTKIALEDDELRLAILTDRAQGGTSLVDGAIDLMIHRRLLHDDGFGVNEPLNEIAFGQGLVVRGQHYLMFGSKSKSVPTLLAQERFLQLRKLMPSAIFFSNASKYTHDEWMQNCTNMFSGLGLSLPQNVNLLTLEPWKDGELLVRFEHILERTDDPQQYSQSVTFNLAEVMRGFSIAKIRETTLSANQWINEVKRFKFEESTDQRTFSEQDQRVEPIDNLEIKFRCKNTLNFTACADKQMLITLSPMQIRTFVLTLMQI